MKKLVNYVMMALCVVFISCTSHTGTDAQKESTILIYSTNDMHAKIDAYAKVIPYMDDVRKGSVPVLLLSAGDMFTGNPYVDFASEPGMPMIELMNEAEYDWATVGNHEFDYGQAAFQRCLDAAKFGFVCANIHTTPQAVLQEKFEPYTFFNVGGTKVCILGLLETENSHAGKPIPTCHPNRVEGLEFDEPLEKAKEYRYLRDKCDLFVALTHLGVKGDSLLALQMPELDVIVGGHTDTKIEGNMLVKGVLVTQAGGKMKYLGKTTVKMKGKQVVDKDFELLEVAKMEEDPAVKARIQEYYDDPSFSEVIGMSADEFPTQRSVVYMVADVIREYFKVDFSFANIGGVRCESFPKGEVQRADVLKVSPFNNDMMMVKMTAADIRSLLINTPDHLNDEVDLAPSGLKYELTYTNDKITDAVVTDYEGRPLDETKVYTVAMNSFIALSYTYDCKKPAASLDCTEIELLERYLKEHVIRRSPDENRWKVNR